MAETLNSGDLIPASAFDINAIQRVEELWKMRMDPFSSCKEPDYEKLIESCAASFLESIEQVEAEEEGVALLGDDDLELYLDQLKKEIHTIENEKVAVSTELEDILKSFVEGSAKFVGELDGLDNLVKQGHHYTQDGVQTGGSCLTDVSCLPPNHKFEILELCQCIENSSRNLRILQELDYAFKRVEAVEQIEGMFSGIKVLEASSSHISLALRVPFSDSECILLKDKWDFNIEPFVSDYKLLINFFYGTLEIKNVEIFPDDVYLGEILNTLNSSRQLNFPLVGSQLRWLVRQIEMQILLCALRKLLVKDASKSRYSLEYSDKDECITAHLVGGIDAFIKVNKCWPMSRSPLKLVSLKSSDLHSRSISLILLCKVKDLSNSFNMQVRCHLTHFIDAIEETLLRETRSELQSNGTPS